MQPLQHREAIPGDPSLQRLVARVSEQMRPLEIWLFGSRAEGRARPSSDYDLLVVLPDTASQNELDAANAWHLGRDVRVLADIVPCTRSEFEEEKLEPGTLVHAAFSRGLRVYER